MVSEGNMKEKLRNFCRSIDIEDVGIAPIGPYVELENLLRAKAKKDQYTEFENRDLKKRIDPSLTMKDVRSVIVCLFPYYIGEQINGNIAKYSYAADYHTVVKDKLEQIGAFLTKAVPELSYQGFVDTGPLVDRYLAHLAGLGFYGQNGHIITDKYGSYVFIGYLLINHSLESDKPLPRTCIQCGACQEYCPGQAILGDFTIDPRRCRSYLTQKKGDLTAEEISIMGKNNLIFGCDVCQKVCPHNQHPARTTIPEFQENIISELCYEELSAISNKEFMRRYGSRAFSWRGRKMLVRNFEYLS